MPTSALDKLLAQSGSASPAGVPADPASDMILAAQALADDLHVLLLAWSDDDDDDSDDDDKGKSSPPKSKSGGGGNSKPDDSDDDDDDTAAMVKKLVAKGVPLAKAKAMAANAAKKVAAAALAEGISVALSSIAVMPGTTLEGVRRRMQVASHAWQPNRITLSGGDTDEHIVRLAVLTTEQRKKPSAHTIPGSEDFPIPDEGHLTAAVARYKQGALAGHSKDEVARHIRSSAKRLGKEVDLVAG